MIAPVSFGIAGLRVMRTDLLEAYANIEWAVAQLPILEARFNTWVESRPYEIVMEDDPNTGHKLMVARMTKDLDPLIRAEAGQIINATRSSLDLLAASLALRNSVQPTSHTHFPIRASEQNFLDIVNCVKGKKWLSDAEAAKLKTFKPYKGGDDLLWWLHQADIIRKHERLITVDMPATSAFMAMYVPGMQQLWRRENGKTVLFSFPGRTDFEPTESNTNLTLRIALNEPSIGLVNREAMSLLLAFANCAAGVIRAFDTQ